MWRQVAGQPCHYGSSATGVPPGIRLARRGVAPETPEADRWRVALPGPDAFLWEEPCPIQGAEGGDGETGPQEMRRASHPRRQRQGVERLLCQWYGGGVSKDSVVESVQTMIANSKQVDEEHDVLAVAN